MENAVARSAEANEPFPARVAEKVRKSVVQVDVVSRDDVAPTRGEKGKTVFSRSTGSGVVLRADGLILTNDHVLDGALRVFVKTVDGRSLPAELVGRDPLADLALLRVAAKDLEPATFGDAESARVGQSVFAVGSPFGLGMTVTAGILSAKGRAGLGDDPLVDYLQTDASINPGNSGGPLCDNQGKVLAINTMIVGRGQGIGFAVPAEVAKKIAEKLEKHGHVDRPFLGLSHQDLTPELARAFHTDPKVGVLVSRVDAKTPAALANLEAGDLLLKVDGVAVHDSRELSRVVARREPGEKLVLEVVRDGKHYQSPLTLGTRPGGVPPKLPMQLAATSPENFGMKLAEERRKKASGTGEVSEVRVAAVDPGSPADRAGIRAGDRVLSVDGTPVSHTKTVLAASSKKTVLLRLERLSAGDPGAATAYFAALER